MKTIFIFEAFRIKHYVAREALYGSLNVLKEIESPGRVKLYIGFAALWECTVYILPGLFVASPRKTSGHLRRLVRVTIFFSTYKRICSQLLSETETTTANDMTADRWLKRFVLCNSLWGIIGGKLHCLTPSASLNSGWSLTLNLN